MPLGQKSFNASGRSTERLGPINFGFRQVGFAAVNLAAQFLSQRAFAWSHCDNNAWAWNADTVGADTCSQGKT